MIIGISGKIGSGKDTVGEIIQYLTSPNIGSKGTYEECKQNGFIYDVVFENKKFADKLKDMVCMMLGCTRERLEDREFKESPLSSEWDTYGIQFTYPDGTKSEEIYGKFSTVEEAVEFERNERRALNWDKTLITNIVPIKLTPRIMLQLLGTDCGRDILHPNIWVNATMADYKKRVVTNLPKGGMTTNVIRREFPNWIITDMRFENEADAVINSGGIAIRINRGNQIKENEHSSETGLDNYENWDEVIENNGTISELVEKVKNILQKYDII